MAAADLRRPRRPGARQPDAAQRHPQRPRRARLPVHRRARRRQDHRRAHPRQGAQLRERARRRRRATRAATAGRSPPATAVDVLEIDGASNTGVDDVRELIENVRYQPAKSRFKIYIIDEVHMLSTSAFNALLKTLEEPPPHVKFIFATTEPHKVPPTILSRCQRYDFKRIPLRLIADRLAQIARSEGIEVSDRALFLIAREGDGSMRDAQSLLDQVIAFAGKTVRDEDVVAALGLADRKVLYAVGRRDRRPQPGARARAARRAAPVRLRHAPLRARAARALPQPVGGARAAERRPAARPAGRGARRGAAAGAADERRGPRSLPSASCWRPRARSAACPYPKLVMEMTLIKLATLTPVAGRRRAAGAPRRPGAPPRRRRQPAPRDPPGRADAPPGRAVGAGATASRTCASAARGA